ncbi:MAG: DUF4405 domain-containing protein [Candidatus Moranbacteria bacterium]|nr:DUF4405 domain-containing protein [Candidatus Moranbacteria bacterium]
MAKAKTNYIIDFLLLVSFLVTAVSGFVMAAALPSGVGRGSSQSFLGIARHGWVGIHDFFGIVLVILVILHFILHWNWLACMTKNFFKKESCETKIEKEA